MDSAYHSKMTTTRNPGIDLLRGLAVLLVVLHHINLRFTIDGIGVAQLLPHALTRVVFWTGYQSVITFFVISGFLITGLSLKRWGPRLRISLPVFYRLRAARILPTLLLLLAVSSTLHLMAAPGFAIKPAVATLPRALLAALGMHVNWLEGHHGYLPGNWDILWSLSIEEGFYLLFPLACLLLRSRPALVAALLALIIIGPINRTVLGDGDPWPDYAWLSCTDGLAFGCLAALAWHHYRPGRTAARWLLSAGLLATVLVIVLRGTAQALGLTHFSLNITLLEAGIACLLMAFQSGLGTRALATGTSLIRLAGRCSYEIYLSHMFIVLTGTAWFARVVGLHAGRAAILLTYAMMLTLAVALGWLVSRCFSEPMNQRLRPSLKALLAAAPLDGVELARPRDPA